MTIGKHSKIASTGSDISAQVTIGNYTSIGPYVQMHSRTQHACIKNPDLVSTYQLDGYPQTHSKEKITIGSDVWIGRNAVLLGGITIGHGAIVGAYSVVATTIPPYAVVVGNPAQIIRYRFSPKEIESLLEIAWWDLGDEEVAPLLPYLTNVTAFLDKYKKK